MATDKPTGDSGGNVGASGPGEALDVRDVLSGIPLDTADAAVLGAYITFETVGNNTVVSVDTDGPGPSAPIQIVTLTNVTGMTLQQLLNDIPVDGN